jgi:hypothetical protein
MLLLAIVIISLLACYIGLNRSDRRLCVGSNWSPYLVSTELYAEDATTTYYSIFGKKLDAFSSFGDIFWTKSDYERLDALQTRYARHCL